MRVADVHRGELDRLAAEVEQLRRSRCRPGPCPCGRGRAPEHRAPRPRARRRGSRTASSPVAAREPACGDAGAVAGELRGRAVRVPDRELREVVLGAQHLENPVRADARVVVAEQAHTRPGSAAPRAPRARAGGSRCGGRATWRDASAYSRGSRRAARRSSPRALPAAASRRADAGPGSGASTCAGTPRSGACGPRSAAIASSRGSSANSRRPRTFAAVVESGAASAARDLRLDAARRTWRASRMSMRRASSSGGTSMPKRTAGARVARPTGGRPPGRASGPGRRARARARAGGDRSGGRALPRAGPRGQAARARRRRRARPPRRRSAPVARAAARAERAAPRAPPGSRVPCRRRGSASARPRAQPSIAACASWAYCADRRLVARAARSRRAAPGDWFVRIGTPS